MSRRSPDPLVMRAARRPDEAAIRGRSAAWPVDWSRAQLLEATDSLAATLSSEGIIAGDRVALLLADDVPAVVLIEAVRRLGAVLVPLNRRAAALELRELLGRVVPAAVVHDREHAEFAQACTPDGIPRHRVEALMAAPPCAMPPHLFDEVDLDAPAMIVFTSGTTARAKGVILTHGNLATSAHAWSAVLRPRPTDRWLLSLPLFHVAGLAIVTRAIRWGAELEVRPVFDAGAVSRAIDAGASHLSLVPAQLSALMTARTGQGVPDSLRAVLLGGGPIPAELLGRARADGYPVLTTYGMTETASGVAVGGLDAAVQQDPGAARALPGVELRVEPDGAADGSGEILVRGEMVFAGYVDDPAGTAVKLQDGWLRSGDVGTLDDSGFLRILDRRDDIIISGGENIAPTEVEDVLAAHPTVAEVAVVGLPDARWGAVPAALVVLRPGAHVLDDELTRHCRARLAGYKVPARFVYLDALPRNSVGKILRRDLRELLLEATT